MQQHFVSRRNFLKASAVGGALTTFSPRLFAQEARPDSLAGLTVHTRVPANAESPLPELVKSWITPNELFYVRSHAAVPQIDLKSYRLIVEGLVETPLSLSLEELQQNFQATELTATMTCAGNRRYEHSRIQPVGGVPWQEGAIGNAKWSGIILGHVLRKAGVKENAKHVWFDGLDAVEKNGSIIPFGASIPIAKVFDKSGNMPGALLCDKMNGQPLPPDHGWPLRTVVPGYIGARSVKWLGKITVSDRPTPNHFVATAYKLVQQGTDLEWAEQAPLYRYPLNSVICTPSPNASIKTGLTTIAGFALPPGNASARIQKVEVSSDNGKSWTTAKLSSPASDYCWMLWTAEINVTGKTDEVLVKATDDQGKSQPRKGEWNQKGYMYDGWHGVPLRVES